MNHWRLQLMITASMSVALLASPLITAGALSKDAQITAGWWPPVSVALVVSAAIAMLVGCTRAGRRVLRPAVVYSAVASIVAVGLWFFAWNGETRSGPVRHFSWISFELAFPALAILAFFGFRWATAYLIVSLSLLAAAQEYGSYGQLGWGSFGTQMITVLLTGVFLAMVRSALVYARKLDADRLRVLTAAADVAATQARQTERERIDAVVRDRVVAALRDARPGVPDEAARAFARTALDDLSSPSTTVVAEVVDPVGAQRRIREAVFARSDDIDVQLDVDDDASSIPATVVDAVVGAVDEALDNSVRYAGPGASRIAVGRFGAEGLRLRIVDDGSGFDSRRVPLDRSGVALGICGRMNTVPGGRGVVESELGHGTMVSIEWRRLR